MENVFPGSARFLSGKQTEKMYDLLIVGAGLYGAVFAAEAAAAGYKCLVIDKRKHIGGNVYTEDRNGINVHVYGAHIFHTDNEEVWNYVNRYASFNRYTNSPIARYKGELYNLPFNMNTFHALWGVVTPEEAKAKIREQVSAENIANPGNLEEQALSLGGRDIYEKLVKGYTEKQWGRRCSELPAEIIKRLPFRFVYDNNYFNDRFQGIPIGGYTKLVEKLLTSPNIDVRTEVDFFENRKELEATSEKTVFTGQIDAYFDYSLGALEYRSLRFETEELDIESFQGNAVVNYTEYEIPYTRIIEHKFFELTGNADPGDRTVITREYPCEWKKGDEPYYPLNDSRNEELYKRYAQLAGEEKRVIFGGRLGRYKYFDMDDVIADALADVRRELV